MKISESAYSLLWNNTKCMWDMCNLLDDSSAKPDDSLAKLHESAIGEQS